MTEPLAYSLRTAAEAVGCSERVLMDEINRGGLKAKRATDTPGSKLLIPRHELELWLLSRPDARL